MSSFFLENEVSVIEASTGKCQENSSSSGKARAKRYREIKERNSTKTTKFSRCFNNLMF